MNNTKKISLVAATLVAALSLTAQAASVATQAAPAGALAPPAADPAEGTDPSAAQAPIVPNSSRTVQLLLQLQEAAAPAGSDTRVRAGGTDGAAPDARRSLAPTDLTAGHNPFGEGLDIKHAANKPAEVPAAVSWSGGESADSSSGGSSSTATERAPSYGDTPVSEGVSHGESDERMSIVPIAVIRFVRRNRDLVIGGAVLALVLIGIGAGSASRRS